MINTNLLSKKFNFKQVQKRQVGFIPLIEIAINNKILPNDKTLLENNILSVKIFLKSQWD